MQEKRFMALIHVWEKVLIELIHMREKKLITQIHVQEKAIFIDVLTRIMKAEWSRGTTHAIDFFYCTWISAMVFFSRTRIKDEFLELINCLN